MWGFARQCCARACMLTHACRRMGLDTDGSSALNADMLVRRMIENGSLQFRRSPPTLAHHAHESSLNNSGSSALSSPGAARSLGRRGRAEEEEGAGAGDRRQEAPTARREGDVGTEFARLTLVLNLEYNSLVPVDSRGRDSVKQHLALAIAGAARVEATRVKVLQVGLDLRFTTFLFPHYSLSQCPSIS